MLATILFFVTVLTGMAAVAQKKQPLPQGTVFGIKPDNIGPLSVAQLVERMDRQTRITTAVRGRVIRVTKTKGGWFEMDAGMGRVIAAHFKNYNIQLPKALRGRIVVIEGVAQKLFIADDMQHFAGDTVVGNRQHRVGANPKRNLTFEIRGLMVDK